jgi:lipoprotein-anchoring transpeptidase ErfK/SrfK
MVGLRRLAKIYLMAASSFAVAIVISQHPALYHATKVAARIVGRESIVAGIALNQHILKPGWHAFETRIAEDMKPAPNAMRPDAIRMARKEAPLPRESEAPAFHDTHVAAIVPRPAAPSLRPPIIEIAPNVPADTSHERTPPPDEQIASAAPPRMTLAPQTQVPSPAPQPPVLADNVPANINPPSQAQLTRVAQHFHDSLTNDMLAHFDLFLFVSKAATAPVGQRMYVFQKQGDGDLAMLYNWPVSTGREKFEIAPNGTKAPTFTPAGYYEIDPKRMYVSHYSGQWHQPMPHAMFFNWMDHGYQTGLAIHGAAPEDIKFLGERSSAGCVHLSPQNAAMLFNLIRTQYKGMVPKFAYDKHTATMASDGRGLQGARFHRELRRRERRRGAVLKRYLTSAPSEPTTG